MWKLAKQRYMRVVSTEKQGAQLHSMTVVLHRKGSQDWHIIWTKITLKWGLQYIYDTFKSHSLLFSEGVRISSFNRHTI